MALRYSLPRAVHNLSRNWRTTLNSVLIVASSIAVLGMIVLLYVNVQHASQVWLANTSVSLFLEPKLNAARQEALLAKVRRHPMVQTAQLVSPQEGLAALARRLGTRQSLFEGDAQDVLPYTIDFELYVDYRERIDEIARSFKAMPGVADVVYAEQVLDKVQTFFSLTQSVGLFFVGLMLVSFCLIVANAIKLSMHARIEEIEILTLIGATRGFVRVGLVMEGMAISLAGGVLAVGLIWGAYRLLLAGLSWDALTQELRGAAVFFPWAVVGYALLVIVSLGGLASHLSVNRVLRGL